MPMAKPGDYPRGGESKYRMDGKIDRLKIHLNKWPS